jgi:hypothetical protein
MFKLLSFQMGKDKALINKIKNYQKAINNESGDLIPKVRKKLKENIVNQDTSKSKSTSSSKADDPNLSEKLLIELKLWWASFLKAIDRVIAFISSLLA